MKRGIVVWLLLVAGMVEPVEGAPAGSPLGRGRGGRAPQADPNHPDVLRENRRQKLYAMRDRDDLEGMAYLTLQWGKETDPEFRRTLAHVLTAYKHPDALPAITLAFAREKEPRARTGIVEGLGWSKDERGLPLLFRLADVPERDALSRTAVQALREHLGEVPSDDPVTIRIGKLLVEALRDPQFDGLWIHQTIGKLGRMNFPELGPPLLELFRRPPPHESARLRAEVASVLMRYLNDPVLRPSLLADLEKEQNEYARTALLKGLAQSNDPEGLIIVVRHLRRAASMNEANEVNAIVDALVMVVRNQPATRLPAELAEVIGEVKNGPYLNPHFNGQHVFEILAVLPPSAVVPVLLDMWRRPQNPNDIHRIIQLLAVWHPVEAVGPLTNTFSSAKNQSIQQEIMDALTDWPGEDVSAFLVTQTKSADPVKKDMAIKALDVRGLSRPGLFTPR